MAQQGFKVCRSSGRLRLLGGLVAVAERKGRERERERERCRKEARGKRQEHPEEQKYAAQLEAWTPKRQVNRKAVLGGVRGGLRNATEYSCEKIAECLLVKTLDFRFSCGARQCY